MRWILLTLVVSTFSFCATRQAITLTDRHAETFWEWAPGTASSSLEDLDPQLHAKVNTLIQQLSTEGYTVEVVTTWRSPMRQLLMYSYSTLRHWAGLGLASASGPRDSCHTRSTPDGTPNSLAIDLKLAEVAPLKRHAHFFHRLGALALEQELVWGGHWKRTNAQWRRFNLGWDPGHLELSICRLTHQ